MNAAIEPPPEAILGQAVDHHRAGRLAQAEALYRKVLAVMPANAEALHHLGLLGLQTGHPAPAEELLARAARGLPDDPVVLNNWGIALARLGRLAEARARFESAVKHGPGYADARVNLANVLAEAGDAIGAETRYREAIGVAPQSAEAHNNLGKLLLARRRIAEAIACFEAALRINPRHATALNNLGNALRDQGRLAQALALYRESLQARPDYAEAFSNLLFAMNSDPDATAEGVLAAHREFAQRFERPLEVAEMHGPRRAGRIRVGYVSADFRGHAIAAFAERLFACHDRRRFEVTAYYNAAAEDEVTSRIRGAVEHFTVVAGLSDAELAQRVRADGIDVLVDLSGHTAGNRLLAFARRAAPVQATWLGYLNTTGLSAMDFRITDRWADPPGVAERWHTEKLVRLPGSLWCYRPWPESPPVAPSPALRQGHVTFGSANNPAKLNDAVLETWGRILLRVPGSRLVIHAPDDGDMRQRLTAALGRQQVAADRLAFVPRLPVAEYLRHFADIDVALDTFPCTGGTTTLDALWMGVPVVSLAGERPFSRGGASILGNLGLTDCLAETREEYVDRAVALAVDPAALGSRRASLRDGMAAGVLTDAPAFARAIESAFVDMCAARGLVLPEEP